MAYANDMTDHIALLRERLEKAEAKVDRYRKSLKTAEKEHTDLLTALRVIEEITNVSESNASGTPTTIGRQLAIVNFLGVGRENAKPPADLYATYNLFEGEDITIDTFRTTIWRMKDRVFEIDGADFVVHGDSGAYWKEAAEPPEPEHDPDFDYPPSNIPDHWGREEPDF